MRGTVYVTVTAAALAGALVVVALDQLLPNPTLDAPDILILIVLVLAVMGGLVAAVELRVRLNERREPP